MDLNLLNRFLDHIAMSSKISEAFSLKYFLILAMFLK